MYGMKAMNIPDFRTLSFVGIDYGVADAVWGIS